MVVVKLLPNAPILQATGTLLLAGTTTLLSEATVTKLLHLNNKLLLAARQAAVIGDTAVDWSAQLLPERRLAAIFTLTGNLGGACIRRGRCLKM
jgi:hypothetical protein